MKCWAGLEYTQASRAWTSYLYTHMWIALVVAQHTPLQINMCTVMTHKQTLTHGDTHTHTHAINNTPLTDLSNTTFKRSLLFSYLRLPFCPMVKHFLACMISFNFDFLSLQDRILDVSNFQAIPQFSTLMRDNTCRDGCFGKVRRG